MKVHVHEQFHQCITTIASSKTLLALGTSVFPNLFAAALKGFREPAQEVLRLNNICAGRSVKNVKNY